VHEAAAKSDGDGGSFVGEQLPRERPYVQNELLGGK
jgi:hypothetical protein